jgi:hypothetical protein
LARGENHDLACCSKEKLRDLSRMVKVSNQLPRANAKSNEEAWLGPTELLLLLKVQRRHSDGGRRLQKMLVPVLGFQYLL